MKTLYLLLTPHIFTPPLQPICSLSSNHSEIYPSLSTAADTHHSAPPAKITAITPLLISLSLFSSLYPTICPHQVHCSNTLLSPCHSLSLKQNKTKKTPQNYCCYLLPILQNPISLLWHSRYLPPPPSIGPHLPFPLFFYTPVLHQASFPVIFYSLPCKYTTPCSLPPPCLCWHLSFHEILHIQISKLFLPFKIQLKSHFLQMSSWSNWAHTDFSFLQTHCSSIYHNSSQT